MSSYLETFFLSSLPMAVTYPSKCTYITSCLTNKAHSQPLYPQVLHLQIQQSMGHNIWEKIPESSKKQN